ncbi:MAG: NUDIX domain-containing protein [Eubacteriales bacterium]
MWIGGARAVIFDDDKRILLVSQEHDGKIIWMVPGGGVEENENSKDAAIREIKEETGLDIEIESLLWHVEEVSEDRGQRFVNFFKAKVVGGELALGIDPEFSAQEQVMRELKFVSQDEIQKLEHVYPKYLREEVWRKDSNKEVFKIRKD